MTKNQPTHHPLAVFKIERDQKNGYQVTSKEGQADEQCEKQARELLDNLGQPDQQGPKKYFRLIGPISPLGKYVSVTVELLTTGEACYYQAWFQIPKPVPLFPRSVSFFLLGLSIYGLFLLVFLELTWRPSVGSDWHSSVSSKLKRGTFNSPLPQNKDKNHIETPQAKALHIEIDSSKTVLSRLKNFLSQEGLAADISKSVIEEKRSVRLIDDVDLSSPKQPSEKLNNIEVAKLLKLLQALDEWAKHSKPQQLASER